MSHREREIVPDGWTSEIKGELSLKFIASLCSKKYAIISRGAESALWGVQLKEVRKVRRSSASDHAVADCSNLVFYSAFYWQPVQTHKKGKGWGAKGNMFTPCRQDEQHSSSHAELCLLVFEAVQTYN